MLYPAELTGHCRVSDLVLCATHGRVSRRLPTAQSALVVIRDHIFFRSRSVTSPIDRGVTCDLAERLEPPIKVRSQGKVHDLL